jgi:hypothetical protein
MRQLFQKLRVCFNLITERSSAAANFPGDPLVAFHHERLKKGENGDTVVMAEK